MRVTGKRYSAREMAEFARCSPLELEYLSEIRLLVPEDGCPPGPHRYDDVNLLRLQQIRIGRARGLALEEIRRWLDSGAFGVLGPPPPHPVRGEPLYLETEAKLVTQADQAAYVSEAEHLYMTLAACLRQGLLPEDRALQRWAVRHCCHINRWFCPCNARQHVAFARAMASHPLHKARIEHHGRALTAFMLRVVVAQPRELLE